MNNPESSPDTQSTSERRAKPPLRVRLAVVALSLLFALLIFELFLRLVGYTYPVFYRPDEVRGYSLWPGAEGRYRREGTAHVRINSDGLRDREHAKSRPRTRSASPSSATRTPRRFRSSSEQAFWSVLEQNLRDMSRARGA